MANNRMYPVSKGGNKIDLQCNECKRRFKRSFKTALTAKCPKCGSYDIEPDYNK